MTKLPPSRLGLLTLSVVSVLGLTACGNSSESIKPTSSAVPSHAPTIPAKPTAPTTGTTVTTPATGTAPAPKPPVTTPAPTTATTTPTGNTIAPAPTTSTGTTTITTPTAPKPPVATVPPTTTTPTPPPVVATPKPPVSVPSGANFDAKIVYNNEKNEQAIKTELDLDSVKVTARYWGGKKLDETFVDLSKLANDLLAVDERVHMSALAEGGQHEGIVTQKYVIYKQPYSVVAGQYFGGGSFPTLYEDLSAHEKFDSVDFAGQATQILPTTGLYNYKGFVFDKDAKKGELSYAIDFATKLGKGSANINGKSAVLDEATISQFPTRSNGFGFTGYGIAGKASSNGESGHYDLGIFGDKAQEIAGRLEFENERFGLAGTHQK